MTHLKDKHIELYTFQSKKEGKSYCGDAFFYFSDETGFLAIVADGLGSGIFAHESAEAAIEAAKQNRRQDVETIMKACNQALLNKRGAAVSVLKIDYHNKEFTYSSVGNVKFYFLKQDGTTIYPLPVYGYLSGKNQLFITQTYRYEVPSRFFIHTDGLNELARKRYVKMNIPLKFIYRNLTEIVDNRDDTTFLIGSLH
ncbi:negative regulator of sigma-B (phosphoserine phosphatase) [Bacillus oleivorans]|uniref:Negative regulator of sigma-B (Phosphoserine phosphatase) n=1 Tax=Bacillus oleivorans TaxID=1448271 RepID=A0A285D5G5_9BACI|nr:SpoIIE family protein phosphatase [Bacillus oleivorans]SNX74596.1 negative regulator of sigma-B (phosphoserine phosphatase) [Bacillus oleivorans]